jgi:hypothetical protein
MTTTNAQIEEAINLLTANGYYIVVNDTGRHDAQIERYVLLGHAMIERCAQWIEDNTKGRLKALADDMRRALKDKPVEPSQEYDEWDRPV